MNRRLTTIYANTALGLCLFGVLAALLIAGWNLVQPQRVSTADARHALLIIEAIALFLGGLAWRNHTAIAAMIIAGVLVVVAALLA
jgi:hypothetical protein